MSQGKEFTEEERLIILESLKDYLELGFSRSRACKMIGFNETTLSKWLSNSEALSMKISGWENAMNKIALANIRDAMKKEGELEDDTRKENSWKWAERKMKDEFSTKTETDLTTNGESIQPLVVRVIDGKQE
jgi:hypothetical protein